jgi:GAF domain-containing protein
MAAFPQLPVAETDPIGIQDRDPDSIKTLEDIARGAQYVTGASGSALVLSDGNVMSCRACSGELAPPVGTRLNTETGFTATCVRTGEIIRCDDTGTDPRVDGSSCIELGIRSILAVPLVDGQKIVGVLEVLSNEPNRFSERHAAALKLLARLVETLIGDGSGSNTNPPPDSKSASSEPEKTCASERTPEPPGQPVLQSLRGHLAYVSRPLG